MGLRWPGSGWLPGRVAEARLFRDAACATEGATCFSTVIPSPGTRSYAGACASHQPKRAGSCVHKTALYQRPRQHPQKVLVRRSSPCPPMTVLAIINGKPLQMVCNDTGIGKGFSQIRVRSVEIHFYGKKILQ